ncbi:MAG: Gfo/Idh/MocA family oxidoreductase [Clostridia bacterium]|nr:Gfo/Idh/MocA family oxidoreductase [Clostridia bacterium]
MLRIGIIGAGAISNSHLASYKKNDKCKIVAITDVNFSLANQRAQEYGIEKVYSDYKELLADKEIDAVSIVTPTFTHTEIVIDALKKGKNVLCEKPPALTADDVRKCVATAKETGKLLMYGFVCRFRSQVQYLKRYIDNGKMGDFVYAESSRLSRCSQRNGWFIDKTKSGGILFDVAIHELDLLLYLMGYPKPKSVQGFTSDVNGDLPDKIKGGTTGYNSLDNNSYDKTVESFASAHIILDNGACIDIKSSSVFLYPDMTFHIDIGGEKAGARMEPFSNDKKLEILELTEDCYFNKSTPLIDDVDVFEEEINHFVDCCINKTECICRADDAIILVEILNAIYKSAETGKAVEF